METTINLHELKSGVGWREKGREGGKANVLRWRLEMHEQVGDLQSSDWTGLLDGTSMEHGARRRRSLVKIGMGMGLAGAGTNTGTIILW
jgi:hypothetical protein